MNFPSMPVAAPSPGFYPGIADTEYFRWCAWSQSALKNFGEWRNGSEIVAGGLENGPFKTPAHALAILSEPNEPSEAQEFGTAYHRLLLEPERFIAKYIALKEKIDRRTTAGKAEWARLCQQYGEDCILPVDVWDRLHAMAYAAAANPNARTLLRSVGENECSMVWEDSATGGKCKGRLDHRTIHPDGRHFIVDLKTTRCAHWRMFEKDVARFGYHIQAAMYVDGYAALHGGTLPEYFLVAQETTAPFPVIVYRIPEEVIDSGRVIYRAQLELAMRCAETGKFPGYADDRVVEMTLPAWAVADSDPVAA